MTGLQIGPFALATDRLAFLAGAMVFFLGIHLLSSNQSRRAQVRAWALPAAGTWLLTARAGYVIQHWEVFSAHPVDILKLWQGGISAGAGFAGLAAIAALAVLRQPRAVAPLLGAALAGGLASQMVLQMPRDDDRPRLPATAYATLQGAPVRLDDRSGQPLVLNLWASWCPPCRREMPMMMEVAETLKGAEMIFANQGETQAQVAGFLDTLNLGAGPVSLDPTSSLMRRFEALGLPATLFFDASGTLTDMHFGEISRAELMSQIATLRDTAP